MIENSVLNDPVFRVHGASVAAGPPRGRIQVAAQAVLAMARRCPQSARTPLPSPREFVNLLAGNVTADVRVGWNKHAKLDKEFWVPQPRSHGLQGAIATEGPMDSRIRLCPMGNLQVKGERFRSTWRRGKAREIQM